MKPRYRWPSEAMMCAAFVEGLPSGWTAYPETGGWDILLVRDDGVRVGVEAKLYPNVKVLAQALSPGEHRPGPEFHATLTPHIPYEFEVLAYRVDVFPLSLSDPEQSLVPRRGGYGPDARRWVRLIHNADRADKSEFRWNHPSHTDLPPVIPDSVAGSPSPVQLTPWKVKALRLCIVLRDRGYITSKDFKDLGLSPTVWRSRWLVPDGKVRVNNRAVQKLVPRPGVALPDDGHPEVVKALRAQG